ncbi:MAG TPA: polymer-forming cytoskeletal protein [Thermoanaerobaculia bacterium]|nr:polymer-forming cytoskeletal protein [Thermoanaerobaculia bacterium]
MIWKSDAKQSDLNGFLDSGSHMEGELRFDTSFRVDGKFSGSVISDGDLMVGEGGELEGEISVGRVFISGTIRGNVRALRRVQISPGGKVFADVDTPSLVIEDGAVFEGRCSMAREAKVGSAAAPDHREAAGVVAARAARGGGPVKVS